MVERRLTSAMIDAYEAKNRLRQEGEDLLALSALSAVLSGIGVVTGVAGLALERISKKLPPDILANTVRSFGKVVKVGGVATTTLGLSAIAICCCALRQNLSDLNEQTKIIEGEKRLYE